MDKVTVYTDTDEWYPVWSARRQTGEHAPYGDPLDVSSSETAERWERVFREFYEVQDEIEAAVKAAESASA